MSDGYWRVDEVARQLGLVADEVDVHRHAGHTIVLPAALIQAARRIVEASDQARSAAALERMPISQAVLYLIEHNEVVTAAEVRGRLAANGRQAGLSTVTMALHRARRRGQLDSPSRGSFSRPAPGPDGSSGRSSGSSGSSGNGGNGGTG